MRLRRGMRRLDAALTKAPLNNSDDAKNLFGSRAKLAIFLCSRGLPRSGLNEVYRETLDKAAPRGAALPDLRLVALFWMILFSIFSPRAS